MRDDYHGSKIVHKLYPLYGIIVQLAYYLSFPGKVLDIENVKSLVTREWFKRSIHCLFCFILQEHNMLFRKIVIFFNIIKN